MKKNIIWLVVVVIIAGAAFYGGMRYDSKNVRTGAIRGPNGISGNFRGNNGAVARGNNRFTGGAGAVTGEILSIDKQNLVVKLPDGGSKIVLLASSTPILRSVAAERDDLKVGSQVMVAGTPNQDGSVTARSIQLREK